MLLSTVKVVKKTECVNKPPSHEEPKMARKPKKMWYPGEILAQQKGP